MGQLLSAIGDATYTYTYDNVGNILTANGHTYTYGNTAWRDLLTAYDGQSITYDNSGNPLSYYNGTRWAFTWENGRSLATASSTGKTISYAYDASGLRTSKTVNGVTHYYYYASGKLLRETYGSNVLDFFYDQNGQPFAYKYNGVLYYYITNLQGDVIYILSSSGATVASYKYDPYGNIVSATGAMAGINPLLYRGYYFDQDTGLYYLQSRYYDPKIARFINADSYASTGQGILGNNMFAYCLSNPVAHTDAAGSAAKTCLTADGAIDDTPWWDHSPGGGGFVYHCNDITTQYDGDKFYTQIIAREAWKVIKKGAKWAWDTYSQEIIRQQTAQLQEAELFNEGVKSLIKTYDSIKDHTIVKMCKFTAKNRTAAKLISHGIEIYFAPIPTKADEFLGGGFVLAGILYSTFAWWEAST